MTQSRSFINIWIHFVWAVKKREPLLDKSFRNNLCKHILENGRNNNIYVDMINGVENHLHCLVSLKSTQNVSEIAQKLKGESSKWINDNTLVEGIFEWQEGYGAFSVSPDPKHLKRVRNYIRNQEKHHEQKSFDEEMKEFELMIGAE
jgi:putative transposase